MGRNFLYKLVLNGLIFKRKKENREEHESSEFFREKSKFTFMF